MGQAADTPLCRGFHDSPGEHRPALRHVLLRGHEGLSGRGWQGPPLQASLTPLLELSSETWSCKLCMHSPTYRCRGGGAFQAESHSVMTWTVLP